METSMPDTILRAEHLKKVFTSGKKSFTAVEDVSFTLERGECLGIVGESGSGKSTIARMITRLIETTEGSVSLLGKDITNIKGKELRAVYREMQMVFQMPMESFDPRRTLGDGIGESLRNAGMSRRDTKIKTEELLEMCGLTPEFAARYPHEVSGGQCQRAAIARALAVNPSILICDEATSALDVTVQKQVLELLINLKEKKNLSFLLICHDLALVQAFCDKVLVLCRGKVVEQGTPDDIINHPKEEYTKILVDSVL
ncbi:ABC transporter, ATP-binding protein [Marvinbryantia formatexigens DSM 14469]|uniref:ABC transporter, ATP-binding protein n=2 Tax=Marvinbryantia TaxID=248744 RepID=C6LHH8_9FIRM|nr:ABC transporter, ATP-binding protein [Marvinbryantia formatexigens DSM 14469]